METENEKIQEQDTANVNNDTAREGDYQPRQPRQRVRITAPRANYGDRPQYGDRPRPSYNRNGNEGGFMPEGFGSGLADSHSQEKGEGGYQQRGGYNNQRGGYQQRGGYNNQRSGGYQQREGGYQQREGGYQQREGGYQQREGGYQQREGGYQQRSGYGQNRTGGYNNQRGGYGQNRGGYGQQGGYQQRPYRQYNAEGNDENTQEQEGFQQREGGYQQRGGYGQNRGGYGQNRGGYNNQRGGYGQNRGGYGQNRGGYGQGRDGYGQNRGGYGQGRDGYGQNRGGYGYRQHSDDYDPNAKYSLKKRIEYNENNIDPTQPVRLNKYLANAGVCSRREADDFIEAGVVTVNGKVVTELGTKIMRTDEIKFHDQPVSLEKKVYVLLNKPKDCVTTSDDPQQRNTVMDLVKDACPERIYPVGRLDRNTTGVLLLTNDGDMASKLTHPKFLKKKVYHVFLDKNVTLNDMKQITEGITLDDGDIKADAIEYAHETDKKQVGIEIHSGKNRIVRRIFESLGYRVIRLDRVQFAGLTKKNLRRGDWRFLTEKEVDILRMGAFE